MFDILYSLCIKTNFLFNLKKVQGNAQGHYETPYERGYKTKK